jgi:hypothetical protein
MGRLVCRPAPFERKWNELSHYQVSSGVIKDITIGLANEGTEMLWNVSGLVERDIRGLIREY